MPQETNLRYKFDVYGALTIKNSTVTHTYDGIRIYSYRGYDIYGNPIPNKVLIDNGFIKNSKTYGIYIEHNSQIRDDADITIANSRIMWNSQMGIYLVQTDPLIINNKIISNGNYGIYCSNSNPRIEGSEISSNSGYGMYLQYSSPEIFGCVILSNSNYGIDCYGSSSKPLIENSTVTDHQYNVRVHYGAKPTIKDSTISSSTNKDIYLGSSSSKAMLINTTFNKNKVYFNDQNSILTVKWNLDVKVVDADDDCIPTPNIIIKDNLNSEVVNTAACWDGKLQALLTEYEQNSAGSVMKTPHNITAYYKEYNNSETVTVDANKNVKIVLNFDLIKGDANGDGNVTAVDALMALQMAVGTLSPDYIVDVNGPGYNRDGRITAVDALIILKASVGSITLN
jgi:parallel beta-helix repeat protein